MFQLSELFLTFLFIAIVYYWWYSLSVKEIALLAVQNYCARQEIQFLDCTIALHRFWFTKGDNGVVALTRTYEFEFSSTGELRYSGKVIMQGRRMISIASEPHRINLDEQG